MFQVKIRHSDFCQAATYANQDIAMNWKSRARRQAPRDERDGIGRITLISQ